MLSPEEVVPHGFQYLGIGGVSGIPEMALAAINPDSVDGKIFDYRIAKAQAQAPGFEPSSQ